MKGRNKFKAAIPLGGALLFIGRMLRSIHPSIKARIKRLKEMAQLDHAIAP
jgi:hypothetical protein